MTFKTMIEDHVLEMYFSDSLNQLTLKPLDDELEIDCVPLSSNSYSLILNGKTHYLTINPQLQGYEVTVDHHTHIVKVQDELEALLEQIGIQSSTAQNAGIIQAQIPGLVSRLFVKKGDKVAVNQRLFILEAMKMENEIDSPIQGKVEKIHITTGSKVEKGDLIMEIVI